MNTIQTVLWNGVLPSSLVLGLEKVHFRHGRAKVEHVPAVSMLTRPLRNVQCSLKCIYASHMCQSQASGQEDWQDSSSLFERIQASRTSSQLLRYLRADSDWILKDTRYISLAWDVVLSKRLTEQGSVDDAQELRGFLMEHTMPLVSKFTPSEVSMISRVMVATNSGTAADIIRISQDIQTRMVQFEPKELCMVLWALSSHPGMDKDESRGLFKSLSQLVKSGMGLDHFTARDLSILVWSLGHVGFSDAALLRAAERESEAKITSFTSEDVSRIMHGFSCLKYNPHKLLVLITTHFEKRLDEFSAQDLALFFVSLGKLVAEPSIVFCRAMAKRAKELVPENDGRNQDAFDVHLNALVLWSFARLGLKRTAFAAKSLQYVNKRVSDHKEEDLVAIMWACCRLDLKLPQGLLGRFASAQVSFAETQNISHRSTQGFRYISILFNRSKSAGTIGIDELDAVSRDLTKALEHMSRGIESVSVWETTSLIVALGTMDLDITQKTAQRLQARMVATMDSVATALLPKLAYSIAKLKLGSPSVIKSLSAVTIYKAGVLSPEALVQTSYAFASFKTPCADVSQALSSRLVPRLDSLSSRDKARAAFAFSRMKNTGLHVTIPIIKCIQKKEITTLEPPSLFGLIQAFETVESCPSSLVDASAAAAVSHINSFSGHQLHRIHRVLTKHKCSDTHSLAMISAKR